MPSLSLKQLLPKSKGAKSKRRVAEKADRADKPAGGLSIPSLTLLVMPLVLLAVGGIGFMAFLQFSTYIADKDNVLRQDAANKAAAVLAARVAQYAAMVERVAADPSVVAEDEAQRDLARQHWREHFQALIPGVLRLRFVAPEREEPDDSSTPSLSFACLDLVHQAAMAERAPPVEVHLLRTDDEHVDLVRPVRTKQGVASVVVLSWDARNMKKWLYGMAPAGGYLELRQRSGNLLLASAGDGAVKSGEAQVHASVAGSAWQVLYWAAPHGDALDQQAHMAFLILGGSVLVVVLVLFLILAFVQRQMLNTDLNALVQHILHLHEGWRGQTFTVRLAEFRNAVRALARRIPGFDRGQTDEPTPAQAPQEAAIAEVMFQGKDAVAVEEVKDEQGDSKHE